MNNLTSKREEELFYRFLSLYPHLSFGDSSLSNDYSYVVDDMVRLLLMSQNKETEVAAMNSLDETFREQADISLLGTLNEQDQQKIFLQYVDFIVDIKRKLIYSDKDYRQLFKLKPSYSPSIEAYEEVGYNKLEISPRLSSYALVS